MDGKINIVFEDDYLVVVNKPNNTLVHHSYYARNIHEDSLLQLLRQQTGDRFFPVNRLDRKTSGAILLCKAKEHVSSFQALFDQKTIQKVYHALVRGHVLEAQTIETPVKNERGNYKSALTKVTPISHLAVDIPVEPYPTSRYTILEMQPITGRTHQLRIHANKIAHPIIGDHKYGNRHHNRMFAEQLNFPDLFLHCKTTSFIHPFTDQKVDIHAPFPTFWELCLEQLQELSL